MKEVVAVATVKRWSVEIKHQGDELQDDATAMFLEWRPPRSPLAHLSALAAAGP